MHGGMTVFDRRIVRLRRERAARQFAQYDFLFREVGERLADRLNDIRRAFPVAVDLGCHTGILGRLLAGRGGITTLIEADAAAAMVACAGRTAVVADEEALPFADGSLDAVLSLLSLHWVNDLPGCFAQIRRCLKPDGVFLAALFGTETLRELRTVLTSAELEHEGGVSPRISPFADVRDLGGLLQRAGFALPVVDYDTLSVSYPDPWRLLVDLRGMAETNATLERRKHFSRRSTLFDALARYQWQFGDGEGRVPATFQVIYLIGWAPAAGQPKPLARGSATTSLVQALDSEPPTALKP